MSLLKYFLYVLDLLYQFANEISYTLQCSRVRAGRHSENEWKSKAGLSAVLYYVCVV